MTEISLIVTLNNQFNSTPKRVNVHHKEVRLTVSRNDEDTYTISREQKVSNNSKLGLETQHRDTPISDPAFVNPNSLESCKTNFASDLTCVWNQTVW